MLSNLWKCPQLEPVQWWCGNTSETTPCQTGLKASFLGWENGYILGLPPLTTSLSAATRSASQCVTTVFSAGPISTATTVQASSPASTSIDAPASNPAQGQSTNLHTDSPASVQAQGQATILPTDPSVTAQSQEHSASLPTAIGVGIGIPLGTAVIGFLVFLFWREAKLKDKAQPMSSSHESENKAKVDGLLTELHGTSLPYELGVGGRIELPGTRMVLKPGT